MEFVAERHRQRAESVNQFKNEYNLYTTTEIGRHQVDDINCWRAASTSWVEIYYYYLIKKNRIVFFFIKYVKSKFKNIFGLIRKNFILIIIYLKKYNFEWG